MKIETHHQCLPLGCIARLLLVLVLLGGGILPVGVAQAGPAAHTEPAGVVANPEIPAEWLAQALENIRQGQAGEASNDPTQPASPGLAHDWLTTGDLNYSRYGYSVATAGDVNGDGYSDVIIGAPYEGTSDLDEGKVFVFYGSSSGLPTTANWTAESNQDHSYMGYSVSTAGDVNGDGYSDIIVGLPGFESSSPTTHGLALMWFGSPTGLGDPGTPDNSDWYALCSQDSEFGSVVAPAGDVNGDGFSDVLVGAPNYDSGAYEKNGAVFIYFGKTGGPLTTASTGLYGLASFEHFGQSAATAGNVNGDAYSDIIVGAPGHMSNGKNSSGAAYVYYGAAAGPRATASWNWLGGCEEGYGGKSVSTAGDVNGDGYSDVAVGAPGVDSGGSNRGEVYVWYGASGGLPVTPNWTARGMQNEGQLGTQVAAAGDVNADGYADLIVGQPFFDSTGYANDGRAYIWHGGNAGLGPDGTEGNADWMTNGLHDADNYGASVAAAGDVDGDGFSDVLIGAPGYAYSGPELGKVYAFYGEPRQPNLVPDWAYESNNVNAGLGISVASAGDVNGDGYADIIVGAPGYAVGGVKYGAVFVWYGGSYFSSPWSALGPHDSSMFGSAVDSAGDVNGDGYSDIVVGAYNADSGHEDEGKVYVWYGSSSGLSIWGASWTAESNQAGASFGYSVAGAGDVNGDGYADLAVGAVNYTNGQTEEGAVFVWHGGSDGLGSNGTPANADWKYEGNANNLSLGSSVSSAGDPMRNGYSGLIASAEQAVYGWYGSASGLTSPSYDWYTYGTGNYGASISEAGDVNGDGYGDVLVGNDAYYSSYNNEGVAYAFCGGSGGLGTSVCWSDVGGRAGANFGASVSGAGDVNGDGFADILIGVPHWSQPHVGEGQVRLYFGSSTGPVSLNGGDWKAESNLEDATLGYSVSGAGDTNGDGFADIIAGAPDYTSGHSCEGRAQTYLGNGGGRGFLPRQLRVVGGAPISPLGRSDWQTAFNFHLKSASPGGRGKVKMEWEVKLLSSSFNGSGTQKSSTWITTSGTGTSISVTHSGLTANSSYHWRARLINNLSLNPFDPPHSRWFHMPWNGWNEKDLMTNVEVTTNNAVYLPLVIR
jgi:hypothetical protein